MFDTYEGLGQKLRAAIFALSALFFVSPSSEAFASPLEFPTTSSIDADGNHGSLVKEAAKELKIAERIVAEFETSESHEAKQYMATLDSIIELTSEQHLRQPGVLTRLSAALRGARGSFEQDTSSLHDWRRLALAVDASLEVLRIPVRFVRRVSLDVEVLEPWSDEVRRAWTSDLDTDSDV